MAKGYSFLAVLSLVFLGAASARADVEINPGESIFVSSPQNVSCSKPAPIPTSSPAPTPTVAPGPALRICDCMFDANALPVGQAVGTQGDDLIHQCQSINQNANPFNCKAVPFPASGALTCSCMFNANALPVGQAVGINGSDLIKQCLSINQNAAPFNCASN